MAKKWKDLFNVGEDLDEDLLQADWDVVTEPVPVCAVSVTTATSLRAPSGPHVRMTASHQPFVPVPTHRSTSYLPLGTPDLSSDERPAVLNPGDNSMSTISHSSSNPGLMGRAPDATPAFGSAPVNQNPPAPDDRKADDFDDWDLDFEDLDENVLQLPVQSDPPVPVQLQEDNALPAKRLRGLVCGSTLPGLGSLQPAGGPSPRHHFPILHPAGASSLMHGDSGVLRVARPPPQQSWSPAVSRQPLSPAQAPRPSLIDSTPLALHCLRTPILTNHLVQLVSASGKTPQKTCTLAPGPQTRRFPGPAGLLPQQHCGRSLDDIVVTQPQMPTHGAVARLRGQVPSSQAAIQEFAGGPWATMKAEMGLDEKNPACFLHTYSVVMVLRKAALKQLARNKVPNMAVMVKTLLHTHTDAKAVFQDPTGQMQGTVHRRLLEDRHGELKTGAVLLLKQVGVFSPSPRNHYLNVTPSNLLRIYPPEGTATANGKSSCCLSLQDQLRPDLEQSSHPLGGTLSKREPASNGNVGENSKKPGSVCCPEHEVQSAPTRPDDSTWDADDLDELLGELPEEVYSV